MSASRFLHVYLLSSPIARTLPSPGITPQAQASIKLTRDPNRYEDSEGGESERGGGQESEGSEEEAEYEEGSSGEEEEAPKDQGMHFIPTSSPSHPDVQLTLSSQVLPPPKNERQPPPPKATRKPSRRTAPEKKTARLRLALVKRRTAKARKSRLLRIRLRVVLRLKQRQRPRARLFRRKVVLL